MKQAALQIEIIVKESLEPAWEGWFEDLHLTLLPGVGTCFSGTTTDQAALHGVLARIRDLNLNLVSVQVSTPQ